MDGLVADGSVVLGGPVGHVDTGRVLRVVRAKSEDEVRARLASDSWDDDRLTIEQVEPWALWLRSPDLDVI